MFPSRCRLLFFSWFVKSSEFFHPTRSLSYPEKIIPKIRQFPNLTDSEFKLYRQLPKGISASFWNRWCSSNLESSATSIMGFWNANIKTSPTLSKPAMKIWLSAFIFLPSGTHILIVQENSYGRLDVETLKHFLFLYVSSSKLNWNTSKTLFLRVLVWKIVNVAWFLSS